MAMIIIAIAVMGLLVTFWFSANQTIAHQSETLTHACKSLEHDVVQLFPAGDTQQVRVGNPDLLQQQMARVTREHDGVEGGFWDISSQFFGYAFPTYMGNDIRTEVADSDTTLLRSLSQRAIDQKKTVLSVQRNQNDALIAVACPLRTHESLAAWFMHRSSLVPMLYTVASAVLFALLGAAGAILLARTLLFGRQWYGERDRLIKQAEDESTPVPVTSNINEIQPFLMLLYQSRQKRSQLERSISALEAKLYRNQELSVFGRFSSSMAKELQQRLHEWKLDLAQSDNEHVEDIEHIERLLTSFENLDLRHRNRTDHDTVDVSSWLSTIADYHQHRLAKDKQSVTAICTEELTLSQNLLLLRYAIDTLIVQAIHFGPEQGEVLLKATSNDDNTISIEVIDESSGLSAEDERLLFRQDDVLPDSYGAGLKLVRDAIQSIGGELSYSSDGENSRFILQIPMTNS